METSKLEDKIKEYEHFLEDTLKNDLKDLELKIKNCVSKHKEWVEVKEVVKCLEEYQEKDRDMVVRVPIGDGAHLTGAVTDYGSALINVGLGYLLEMDYDEADKYADIRTKTVLRQIEHYQKLAVQVKVNIKLVLLAINELQSSVLANLVEAKI